MTRRLWLYLLSRCQIDPSTPWQRLGQSQLQALVRVVLHCPLHCEGRGQYRDEFVSAGGVTLKEIDVKTMRSKVVPGLYLCGEVIDVDGVTGGFNFQSAWATGFLAGGACGRDLAPSSEGGRAGG